MHSATTGMNDGHRSLQRQFQLALFLFVTDRFKNAMLFFKIKHADVAAVVIIIVRMVAPSHVEGNWSKKSWSCQKVSIFGPKNPNVIIVTLDKNLTTPNSIVVLASHMEQSGRIGTIAPGARANVVRVLNF